MTTGCAASFERQQKGFSDNHLVREPGREQVSHGVTFLKADISSRSKHSWITGCYGIKLPRRFTLVEGSFSSVAAIASH